MIKNISRIIALSIAVFATALIAPGFDLGSSMLVNAGLMGVGLWGVYEVARMSLRKYYGLVDDSSCPLPRVLNIMGAWFIALTVAWVFVASALSLAVITAFYWGVLAGLLLFVLGVAICFVNDRMLMPLFVKK